MRKNKGKALFLAWVCVAQNSRNRDSEGHIVRQAHERSRARPHERSRAWRTWDTWELERARVPGARGTRRRLIERSPTRPRCRIRQMAHVGEREGPEAM